MATMSTRASTAPRTPMSPQSIHAGKYAPNSENQGAPRTPQPTSEMAVSRGMPIVRRCFFDVDEGAPTSGRMPAQRCTCRATPARPRTPRCVPVHVTAPLASDAHCERVRRAGDDGRGALVSQGEPEPVEHHRDSVADTGQIVEVNQSPHKPREDAADVHPADLGNRVVVADLGHAALVEIA